MIACGLISRYLFRLLKILILIWQIFHLKRNARILGRSQVIQIKINYNSLNPARPVLYLVMVGLSKMVPFFLFIEAFVCTWFHHRHLWLILFEFDFEGLLQLHNICRMASFGVLLSGFLIEHVKNKNQIMSIIIVISHFDLDYEHFFKRP